MLQTECEDKPVKSELTLSSEEIHVILELKFEDVVLTDIITWVWSVNIVAQQRKTGQRKVILKCFVEVETEVGEDHPQLLPSVRVFELPEQIAGQLVLQRLLVVHDGHAGCSVPAHVHARVGPLAGGTSVQSPGHVTHLRVETVLRTCRGR